MSLGLSIYQVGVVSPLGLEAASTCAAFHAGLKGLHDVFDPPFPAEPVTGGAIPSSVALRRSDFDWLVNMASRAVAETLRDSEQPGNTALLLTLPGPDRCNPGFPSDLASAFLKAVQTTIGCTFRVAEVQRGDSSSVYRSIHRAAQLLGSGAVSSCCVGAVDSLVNQYEIDRLVTGRRLYSADNPMGVMPSEGAAFVLVGPAAPGRASLANLLGVGICNKAPGEQGAAGIRTAIESALSQAGLEESRIDFVVSDHTGERSQSLDYTIAEMRTFRTRRESLPHWRFAEAAGHLAGAAGVTAMALAAVAHAKGQAPGPLSVCLASADSADAACILQGGSPLAS